MLWSDLEPGDLVSSGFATALLISATEDSTVWLNIGPYDVTYDVQDRGLMDVGLCGWKVLCRVDLEPAADERGG